MQAVLHLHVPVLFRFVFFLFFYQIYWVIDDSMIGLLRIEGMGATTIH